MYYFEQLPCLVFYKHEEFFFQFHITVHNEIRSSIQPLYIMKDIDDEDRRKIQFRHQYPSLYTMAELTNGFHYELLCGIGKRIPRVYKKQGKVDLLEIIHY